MNLFLNPTEEKIAKALKKAAAAYVVDGSDPDMVVKTAALEGGLNAEMTDRLVESFNIAVIRSHLKTAEDKGSATPIADKARVSKLLFHDEPLPASRKAASLEDDEDKGGSGPVWSGGASRKVASAPVHDPGPLTGIGSFPGRIASIAKEDQRRADNARIRKISAVDAAVGAGLRLAERFDSSAGRHLFPSFQMEALSVHGEDAVPIVEMVRKAASIPESGALRNPGLHVGKILRELHMGPEVDLVGVILDSGRKIAEATEEAAALEKELSERSARIRRANGRKAAAEGERPNWLRDFLSSETSARSAGGIVRDTITATDFIESPSAIEIGNLQREGLSEDYALAANKRFKSDRGLVDLNDDETSDLRAFTQSSVLSDLIANDDIISSADPDEVAEAFSNLSRLSPEAASNKAVARSVLRSVLAGDNAMDPFTADQIVSLQEKVMKTRGQIKQPAK
jgi:hypothetical protein